MSKVLCKIKSKTSDFSLLLSWKWCETDNNIVISIFLLFFFMPLPLGELCQVQWWGKWVKVGHTRQTKKNSKTWGKIIFNRILRVSKLILFIEFLSAFQFSDNRYTVTPVTQQKTYQQFIVEVSLQLTSVTDGRKVKV